MAGRHISGQPPKTQPAHRNNTDQPGISLNKRQQAAINDLAKSDPEAILRVMRQWMQGQETKT